MKLGPTHKQSGVFKEGIELLAAQIGLHLRRFALVALHDGAALDAVELDGLLAFGDCRFEIALAERLRLLVADREKRQGLGVVVLVSFFLFFESSLISLAAVEIDIEARVERLPKTRCPRVLLG